MSVSALTFNFVSELVRKESAIQLAPGKEYLVESRLLPLARAMGINGEGAVDQYVQKVRSDRAALTGVVEALTTNETSWFRDNSPFTVLRQTLLPEARSRNSGELRIWSGACSTGQEPYSIAMSLMEEGENHVNILASDLSNAVLTIARDGGYTQLEMNRGMPAPMLVRYFTRNGAGWKVADAVKSKVTFRQHNLLNGVPFGGPFDIVFLRNVLIYFDAVTKQNILTNIARAVRPGGYLVLGAAETVYGAEHLWDRMPGSRGSQYQLRGGVK